MKKSHKKILIVFAALVLLATAGVSLVVRLIDIKQYKPDIEQFLAESTGVKWAIRGDIDLSLFPVLVVRIENIEATNKERLLHIGRIEAEIETSPLLSKEVIVDRIALIEPEIRIRKDKKGNLNIGPPPAPAEEEPGEADGQSPLQSLLVREVSVTGATVSFADQQAQSKIRLTGFDGNLGKFSIIANNHLVAELPNSILHSQLTGFFRADSFVFNGLEIKNISLELFSDKAVFSLHPVKATLHGGEMNALLTLDLGAATPTVSIDGTMTGCRIDQYLRDIGEDSPVEGALDLATKISSKGVSRDEFIKQLNGTVSLRGKNFLTKKFDIDAVLQEFEKSQKFSLADLGGYVLLGPFGPLVTKGYDYSNVYMETGKGQSVISEIVADWQIENGKAKTRDVAFASKENRVACQGILNLVSNEFEQFQVAIIDEQGCPRYSQTLNGPFADPQMENASFVAKSIVNPVVRLFKKASQVFREKKCQPFYTGQVAPFQPSPQ